MATLVSWLHTGRSPRSNTEHQPSVRAKNEIHFSTCLPDGENVLSIHHQQASYTHFRLFYGYYVVFLNLHQSKPLHTSSSLTVPFAANLGQFVYVTFLAHIILLALSYLYGCCMYAQPTQPLSQLCIAGSEVHLFIYPIVQLFLGTQISRPGFKWSGGFLQKCLN